MISRRTIRTRVMQAIYAWQATGSSPEECFDVNLKEFADEIRQIERDKGDKGDGRLLNLLYYNTIENQIDYDKFIASKAENWEIERIALLDRILMWMGLTEILHLEEVPVKVSINEYLELAKMFSTPKSSKFINGILDSLYNDFKGEGKIKKTGRGLIEETLPRPGQKVVPKTVANKPEPEEHSTPIPEQEEEKKAKRPRIKKGDNDQVDD